MIWDPESQIVVAADDHAYMAWQSVVAHYSYVKHIQHTPLIVAHKSPKGEHRYWKRLERAGGRVLRAPSYRGPSDYLARNTAGSLLEAARALKGSGIKRLVLVDGDMVLTGVPELPTELSGEHYGHMFYTKWRDYCLERAAMVGLDVSVVEMYERELSIGVPYVVPMEIAEELALEWIRIIDAIYVGDKRWDAQMYAFSYAALKFGVPKVTQVVQCDGADSHTRPLDKSRPWIHYAYGSPLWRKQSWFSPRVGVEGVWSPPSGTPGTVAHAYLEQIREAGKWFAREGAPVYA